MAKKTPKASTALRAGKTVTFAALRKLDVITATEAAQRLQIDRSVISRYYERGILRCVVCDNRVYVYVEDLKKIQRVRGRRGRTYGDHVQAPKGSLAKLRTDTKKTSEKTNGSRIRRKR